jgi:anti-sigma factor (TIGR02949 family)
VTHPTFAAQLDPYLDGELAAADAAGLEAHLRACPECADLAQRRRALRAAVHARLPRFPAPDGLRARVRAALRAQVNGSTRFQLSWRPLAIAAALVVVAAGSYQFGLRRAAADALADEVLASHVRSLMPGHLSDVASSDQHTVKPWFDGKLDFSPPVADFAGRGFPLLGGRLDYVGGQAVAALVYGRRQHLINVYVSPASRDGAASPGTLTRQGYHLLHWVGSEYSYWVASDLGLPELRDFATLLQQGDSVATAPAPAPAPTGAPRR